MMRLPAADTPLAGLAPRRPAARAEDHLPVSAITVDLEDYFQVSGFDEVVPLSAWDRYEGRLTQSTERLLAVLAESGVRATFFLLGWSAERHPGLVRRIRDGGHELACHSYAHRLVYRLTPAGFREDTRRAKAVVEDIAGVQVIGYRAPSFSITRRSLWALDILAEEGFRYDSSIYPILWDRYGIPGAPRHPFVVRPGRDGAGGPPRADILEIPPSTVRWLGLTLPVGGGGYLRFVPERLFHRALQRLIRGERRPAVIYVHPWELDPEQPRIVGGSRLARFRQYVNLHKTEGRLRRLLRAWSFAPVRDLLDTLAPCARLDPGGLR
jgi:polysaccharide deacetylase family protein (PEP-CTERM system associated)